ncbi:hypothetical protein RAA17_17780 [Komagataeibacter rhaeticus]|nr:hypothetical protein [Komagataeibacter rhaeticus]
MAVGARRDAIATELEQHASQHDAAARRYRRRRTVWPNCSRPAAPHSKRWRRRARPCCAPKAGANRHRSCWPSLWRNPEPPPGVVLHRPERGAETSLRRKVSRLERQREELGPVNLRAEIEAQDASGKIDTILHERDELQSAISRLRGMIGQLNREGRERLMAVFSRIDQHFQALFARMFNGGRAHLGMVGSDDPLQAGLEIYAQPPGKKLATLSLLSGGEQALTALSLIFAVFRCNPAPSACWTRWMPRWMMPMWAGSVRCWVTWWPKRARVSLLSPTIS